MNIPPHKHKWVRKQHLDNYSVYECEGCGAKVYRHMLIELRDGATLVVA